MTLKNLSESQPFVVIKHTFSEAAAIYWEEEDRGRQEQVWERSRA